MRNASLLKLVSILILCIFTTLVRGEDIEVLAVEYPPFTTETDIEGGLCFHYLNEFSETFLNGKQFSRVFVPPARAEALLSDNQFCMAFYPPKKNQELYSFMPLKDEKVKLGLIRGKQKNEFSWQNLSELKGKRIAVLRSNLKSPLIKSLETNNIHLEYVEQIAQGLAMLDRDHVDFVFGDNASLEHITEKNGKSAEAYQFSKTAFMEAQIGFHYKKDCAEKIFGKKLAKQLLTNNQFHKVN